MDFIGGFGSAARTTRYNSRGYFLDSAASHPRVKIS
jgi:hypothetical protein